jgi:phage shock protein A
MSMFTECDCDDTVSRLTEENERLEKALENTRAEFNKQFDKVGKLTEENAALRRELEQWTTDRYAWMMRAKKAEKALASAREVVQKISDYPDTVEWITMSGEAPEEVRDLAGLATTWLKENPE